jgi:group I intron endonuclease
VKSGIYKIENIVNKKVYIGSTKNFTKRFSEHRYLLNKGEHANKHLQRSWDFYGEDNFTFTVIEFVEKNNLLIFEQKYLDCLDRKQSYNICYIAGNTTGVPMPEHVKKNLLDKNIGKTPWNKNKRIKKENSIKMDEEKRKKISETLRKNTSGSKTKLNWEKVREIREKYKKEGIHKAELARIYEVDRSQISRIINNQIWIEL